MNGVVNFYKEAGDSSFAAVHKLRKLFNVSKCGHLGTLDPMAEGVLPICLGYATRFADYISFVDKEYIAEFKLGVATDSFDTTGNILSTVENFNISEVELKKELAKFSGVMSLKVPAFSAKKINGVRAYKLARKGELEDAGFSDMLINSAELLSYQAPLGIIKVSCGKGTYIRSIISQLGENLKVGAAMSGLIRSANGTFLSKDAYRLKDLEELAQKGELARAVTSVMKILDFPKAVLKKDGVKLVKNGVSPDKSYYLSVPLDENFNNYFILDDGNNLLAFAEKNAGGSVPFKIKMVFV